MSLFRLWGFLLPLLVGFGLPALLAWRPGGRGLRAGAVYLAILLSIALVLRLFAGDQPSWSLLYLTLFTLAFAVFVAGLQMLWPSLVVGQVVAGVIVAIMMGSVFYFAPAVEAASTKEEVRERLNLALVMNPYIVTASSIFDMDPLRKPILYRTGLADYSGIYPWWGPVALAYFFVGTVLAFAGWIIRLLTAKAT